MKVAVEALAGARGLHRELTRKEFCHILNKRFAELSKDDQWHVFDCLVEEKASGVTMLQLAAKLEVAAPVRNIEDLRRKLVALGHASMLQVVQRMSEGLGFDFRLTIAQFSAMLANVGVTCEEDQQTTFWAICDRGNSVMYGSPTVSLDELIGALAAVSPMLLLEDLRERLARGHASLAAACDALFAGAAGGGLGAEALAQRLVEVWKLTEAEARSLWQFFAVDQLESVSRRHLLAALNLSEASVFIEEVRHRVRQRFLCLRNVLLSEGSSTDARSGVQTTWADGGSDSKVRQLSEKEACAALASIQLPAGDTQTIYRSMDTRGDGVVTNEEFVRAVRWLVPACFLEGLRLQLLAKHRQVCDAFSATPDELRDESLDQKGLTNVLMDVGLVTDNDAHGLDVEEIMCILKPRPDVGLTVSSFIAALESVAPGSQVPTSPEQVKARVQQQVHGELAPYQKSAKEFRLDVRRRNRCTDSMSCLEVPLPFVPSASRSVRRRQPVRLGSSPLREGKRRAAAAGAPAALPRQRLAGGAHHKDGLPRQAQVKSSDLARVSSAPSLCPVSDQGALLERLHGYYATANAAASTDATLLGAPHSRLQLFRTTSGHRRVLERIVT